MLRLFKFISVIGFFIVLYGPESVAQDSCGAVPQLYPGAEGYVLDGFVVRVRDRPSTAGQQLGELYGGTFFTVVDGFQCSGGYNWWKIQRSGLEGWIVDGDATTYFVEPAERNDDSVTVNSMAWSPDNRWLAIGSDAGAWIFDLTDRQSEPRRIGRPTNDLGFASIDELVIALPLQPNDEYGLSAYDPATGLLLNQDLTGWEGESNAPDDPSYRSIYYAPETSVYAYRQDRWIVAVDGNRSIFLSQIEDGSSAMDLALHPNGRSALVMYDTQDGGKAGIHTISRAPVLTPLNVDLDVTSIALSPGGNYFALGGADGRIAVTTWGSPSSSIQSKVVDDLRAGITLDEPIQHLALSPDGAFLAVSSELGLVILHSETFEIANILTDQKPIELAFSPDGLWLASLSSQSLQVFFMPRYESEIYHPFR